MKSSWLNNISDIYADNGLSAFQKVLIVKALRPDYLHTALSKLAAKQLGKYQIKCDKIILNFVYIRTFKYSYNSYNF